MKTRTHVRRHMRRIEGKRVMVTDHSRILNKDKSYSQLKKQGSRITPYADSDGDGKVNTFDCRPLNPRMQDKGVDEISAKELYLWIQNDSVLYHQQEEPIVKNLVKKKRKGIYDHNKAVKLFGYLAENGAKRYAKENLGRLEILTT